MNNIIADSLGRQYLFAQEKDIKAYSEQLSTSSACEIENNKLFSQGQLISNLIPIQHLREAVDRINSLSLEPDRKMPSSGWRFELYKAKNGFLEEEFTKKEWLKSDLEYVGVSFSIASAFERSDSNPLLSYFQTGGLLEEIAPNIYYYYDRLFAKYGGKPAIFKIEDLPELEGFLKNYMPTLYKDLLETATYELLETFDTTSYVEKIIKNHYTY